MRVQRPSVVAATCSISRKEIWVLFLSPLAWVFLASFLFLAGVFFYLGIVMSGEASLRSMLANLAVTLLFCLPMVTMRSLALERRAGTLELLLTAPVPLGSLIVGKWLAVMALCVVLLGLTAPFPVVLAQFGDPDPGVLVTSYLGLLACCGAFSAAGLFASSLTRDQMVAGVGAVLLLLPSWLASVARDLVPVDARPLLDRISFVEHLRSFAQGVLDTGDIAWFVGITTLFLFLTWRSLESRRWR